MEKQDKPYDNGAKRLLDLCAQDFMDWLTPGAMFTGRRSEAFQSISIEADLVHEALRREDLELVHVEIQSTPDANMEQRLLEYNLLAYRRYQQFVNSFVIFLRDGGENLRPPLVRNRSDGREGLTFHYEVIVMRDKPLGRYWRKHPEGSGHLSLSQREVQSAMWLRRSSPG